MIESTCGCIRARRIYIFCPHWMFYRHKSKFFNKHTKTWNENTGRLVDSESSDESNLIERTLGDRNDLEDASTYLDGLEEIYESLGDNQLSRRLWKVHSKVTYDGPIYGYLI